VPAKSRETQSERDREGRRPSRLCPTEFAHKLFGSSADLAHKTQSKGEPAQRSGSNDVDQLLPIRLIASAREHDFSGYWLAAGGPIL
jgi:hypothetical protein